MTPNFQKFLFLSAFFVSAELFTVSATASGGFASVGRDLLCSAQIGIQRLEVCKDAPEYGFKCPAPKVYRTQQFVTVDADQAIIGDLQQGVQGTVLLSRPGFVPNNDTPQQKQDAAFLFDLARRSQFKLTAAYNGHGHNGFLSLSSQLLSHRFSQIVDLSPGTHMSRLQSGFLTLPQQDGSRIVIQYGCDPRRANQ